MGSLGSKGEILVDLVEEANVELRELGGSSEGGKDWASSVGSSNVEGSDTSLSRKTIRQVTSDLHAGSKSETGRSADLGHVLDIKHTSGKDVSIGVVDANIGTLVSLEGNADARGNLEGSLQHVSAISLHLDLVERQTSIAELRANLGRKSTSATSLGLDCDSDRTGILLALKADAAGEVVTQKVYRWSDDRVSDMSSES